MKRIEIVNGRLINPANQFDDQADLFIADGRIIGIGKRPDGFVADEQINASGHIVCPGLIDLSARLREPGSEHKGTLESELAAAVAGGITRLACPPDTDPTLDEPGLVRMLTHRARSLALAKVHPVGALTRGLHGKQLTEMAELRESGCIAFSHAEAPITDNLILFRAMQYAATFGLPLWLRPQDHSLANNGVAHDGEVATRLGLPSIPTLAESVAISTIVILMKETGARVHLERISSREGVEMIHAAKKYGLPLTCDVSIQHVHLSDIDIGYFDANTRLSPPLRSTRDRDALLYGLVDGTIDAIVSDHTPIDDDAKLLPFGEAEPGATALELLLPLTLRWADQKHLSLGDVLAKLTTGPAAILGKDVGDISVGNVADITVFDPAATWLVKPENLLSQGKHTPFAGMEMRGKVQCTIVDGRVIYRR